MSTDLMTFSKFMITTAHSNMLLKCYSAVETLFTPRCHELFPKCNLSQTYLK